MNFSAPKTSILGCVFLGITACGSGGDGSALLREVDDASMFDADVAFDLAGPGIPENTSLTFTDNGQSLRLRLDDTDYDLTRQSDNPETYTGEPAQGSPVLSILAAAQNGSAKLLLASGGNWGDPLTITYGFQTPEDTVNALTGSTTYSGPIEAFAVQGGDSVPAAAGSAITMTFDFDGSTALTGNLSLGEFAGITSGTTNYVIDDGSLDGDTFTSLFEPQTGSLATDQAVGGSQLEGTFFGSDASAAGGAISMQILDKTGGDATIQGAFLADQQP